MRDVLNGQEMKQCDENTMKMGMLSAVLMERAALSVVKEIMERYPDVRVIASGGVGGTGDIDELKDAGVCEVIVGKAIYEGKISLEELRRYEK